MGEYLKKNRINLIIIILLFLSITNIIIIQIKAANDPPFVYDPIPYINQTGVGGITYTSIYVDDNDSMGMEGFGAGTYVNLDFYWNNYQDNLVFEENCSTIDNNIWKLDGAFNERPYVQNDCWYFTINGSEAKSINAYREDVDINYGYYYVKFKVTSDSADEQNYCLSWLANATTKDEVDMFEIYGGNTEGELCFASYNKSDSNYDNGAWFWYNDWEDNQWHEAECYYNPVYCVMILDKEQFAVTKNGWCKLNAQYQNQTYFTGHPMWWFISAQSDGINNVDDWELIVDHIIVKTGNWTNYYSIDNVFVLPQQITAYPDRYPIFNDTNTIYFWRVNVTDQVEEINETMFFYTDEYYGLAGMIMAGGDIYYIGGTDTDFNLAPQLIIIILWFFFVLLTLKSKDEGIVAISAMLQAIIGIILFNTTTVFSDIAFIYIMIIIFIIGVGLWRIVKNRGKE